MQFKELYSLLLFKISNFLLIIDILVSQTNKKLNESYSVQEKTPVIAHKQRGAWLSMNLKALNINKKELQTQISLRGHKKQIDLISKPLKLKLPRLDMNFKSVDYEHYK